MMRCSVALAGATFTSAALSLDFRQASEDTRSSHSLMSYGLIPAYLMPKKKRYTWLWHFTVCVPVVLFNQFVLPMSQCSKWGEDEDKLT